MPDEDGVPCSTDVVECKATCSSLGFAGEIDALSCRKQDFAFMNGKFQCAGRQCRNTIDYSIETCQCCCFDHTETDSLITT